MTTWLTLQCGRRIKRNNPKARFRIMVALNDEMVSDGCRRDLDEAIEYLKSQSRGGYVVDEPTGEILFMKLRDEKVF